MKFKEVWDKEQYQELVAFLKSNTDSVYKEFSKKLIFTKYQILGLRTPFLRKIAKDISKTNIISYLEVSTAITYEEILLKGFVIGYLKDFKLALKYFNEYLSLIDNWALCDQVVSSMKIVKKNKAQFYKQIIKYLNSKQEFTVRVGLVFLLNYYIEESYLHQIFTIAENTKREEYYINMSLAWLLSLCYIKYHQETLKYLQDSTLSKFTYNKTISKICDSYRVTKEEKELLKKLRKA